MTPVNVPYEDFRALATAFIFASKRPAGYKEKVDDGYMLLWKYGIVNEKQEEVPDEKVHFLIETFSRGSFVASYEIEARNRFEAYDWYAKHVQPKDDHSAYKITEVITLVPTGTESADQTE